MPVNCCVPKCTANSKKNTMLKFHSFPKCKKLSNTWLIRIRSGKVPSAYSKVCSRHFEDTDYTITSQGEWKILHKDAVPSRYLPEGNFEKQIPVDSRRAARARNIEAQKESISRATCTTNAGDGDNDYVDVHLEPRSTRAATRDPVIIPRRDKRNCFSVRAMSKVNIGNAITLWNKERNKRKMSHEKFALMLLHLLNGNEEPDPTSPKKKENSISLQTGVSMPVSRINKVGRPRSLNSILNPAVKPKKRTLVISNERTLATYSREYKRKRGKGNTVTTEAHVVDMLLHTDTAFRIQEDKTILDTNWYHPHGSLDVAEQSCSLNSQNNLPDSGLIHFGDLKNLDPLS